MILSSCCRQMCPPHRWTTRRRQEHQEVSTRHPRRCLVGTKTTTTKTTTTTTTTTAVVLLLLILVLDNYCAPYSIWLVEARGYNNNNNNNNNNNRRYHPSKPFVASPWKNQNPEGRIVVVDDDDNNNKKKKNDDKQKSCAPIDTSASSLWSSWLAPVTTAVCRHAGRLPRVGWMTQTDPTPVVEVIQPPQPQQHAVTTTTRGGGDVATVSTSSTATSESPFTSSSAVDLQPYWAISQLIWGTQPESRLQTFYPGCHLVGDDINWVGRGQWDTSNNHAQNDSLLYGNTPPLWKTMSFLSDIVILVLNTRDPIDLNLVNALEAGFQARMQDLPKGKLLIVLHGDTNTMTNGELLEWKNRLSSTLEGSAPRIVEELQIVSASEYEIALEQMKQRSITTASSLLSKKNNKNTSRNKGGGGGGVCQLADAETFPSLVKQVYRAFGGGSSSSTSTPLFARSSSSDMESLVVIASPPPEPVVQPPTQTEPVQPTTQQQQQQRQRQQQSLSPEVAATGTSKTSSSNSPVSPSSSSSATTTQSKAPTTTKATTASTRNDAKASDPDAEQSILNWVNEQLDNLQLLQENVWLDTSKARGKAIRPINFATKAQSVLSQLEKQLQRRTNTLTNASRNNIISHVKARMRILYQQQLESLRDYYGKLYEAALDKSPSTKWKDAATKTTEKFRLAAQQAIPKLMRSNQFMEDLDLNYYRTVSESGLISDMMESTDSREDPEQVLLEEEEDDDEDDVNEFGVAKTRRRKRRVAKWYEKLAARALVIGVNYVQGWLAWQGIKRAALLREQQMPKFPLF